MTTNINILLLSLILYTVGTMSCAPSDSAKAKQAQDPEGKEVRSITRNTITFEDGSVYRIPADTSVRVVYLTRHAEKDTAVADNPGLSKAGIERSLHLRDILQGTRVDEIYSTLYNRTIMTASEVAAAKGVKILPYKPAGMRSLAADIRKRSDAKRYLIVGHSNTTKSMINVLVNDNYYIDGIDEDDYDNFYAVITQGDEVEVLAMKYRP